MAHWSDGMEWLNPPPSTERDGQSLIVTTGPETDFWRKTFYGFVHDNGHFLHRPVDGDFTCEMSFSGGYEALYDQAGLMLRGDARHWVKAGIEMTDGQMHFSVVVTNGHSDWSQQVMPPIDDAVMMRVSRQGDAIRVAFLDGQARWLSARLAYFPPDMSLSVGPMCCSPTRSGFKARFDSFVIGPAISRDLHG